MHLACVPTDVFQPRPFREKNLLLFSCGGAWPSTRNNIAAVDHTCGLWRYVHTLALSLVRRNGVARHSAALALLSPALPYVPREKLAAVCSAIIAAAVAAAAAAVIAHTPQPCWCAQSAPPRGRRLTARSCIPHASRYGTSRKGPRGPGCVGYSTRSGFQLSCVASCGA